jgi:Biotin-lipoyl like
MGGARRASVSGVMRYRAFLPDHRLLLDALTAAVLLAILGLSYSNLIQDIPASNQPRSGSFDLGPRLLAHLSRMIGVETESIHHRHLLGLPLAFLITHERTVRAFLLCVAAFILLAISAYLLLLHLTPSPPGTPGPTDLSPIVAEASGKIERIYVTDGTRVHTGDPIIQLDTRHLLIRKHVVESLIHAAELSLEDHRYGLSSMYRELQQIQLEMDRFTIISPVDGEVLSLASIYPGKILLAGSAVALVAQRKDQAR